MKVWIINPYGTLPSEGWREYRSSMLARALAARGHQVTWFLSNFEHRSKSFRKNEGRQDRKLPGVEIRCLPTTAYARNISFSRIRYERSFGRAFAAEAGRLAEPDCVVLGEPALFFGGPVRRFARKGRIPLIVDILDLWPEMFDLALPRMVRPTGRWLFSPLYARRRRLLREATGVATCTSRYTEIAEAVTERPVRTFYLGVDIDALRNPARPQAVASRLPSFPGLTCVYAGTLGDAYDIPCLAETVTRLAQARIVRLIVAGSGPAQDALRQLEERYRETLVILGEVPPDELGAIYAQAQIGLCTYAAGSTVSMPVKLFDYLAAGLGIVTSLTGEIADLTAGGAGRLYPAGDSVALATLLSDLARAPHHVRAMQCAALALGQGFDQRYQHDAFARFIEELVDGQSSTLSTIVNK